jgi:hypothetical protein
LFGGKPEITEQGFTMGIGGLDNHCKQLSFRTTHGTFTSTGKVQLSRVTIGGREQEPINFYVQEGRFEIEEATTPKYFAIPLFNCVAEPTSVLHGDHPLRVFPTPKVPDGIPDSKKFLARWKANEKNSVIGFLMKGKVCFIERLPDYNVRLQSLENGAQRSVTAVLVGELDGPSSSISEFRSWFPFEALSALGFASGVETGVLWIEIRDENGRLLRRLHGRPHCPLYWDGDAVIGKFDRAKAGLGGHGSFITGYLNLAPEARSYLEVAMNHARLGSIGAPSRLYDILDHLIRAFECLCREHGFVQQDLLTGLTAATREKVKDTTAAAISEIQQLLAASIAQTKMDEQRLLATIQGRLANVATTEKKFGLAVVSLLEHFGFTDAGIIGAFIAANPRSDGLQDWASVLSNYRGATIHEGYMDFEKKHDANDVVRICLHLKDAITRIVLKECGYDGTYISVLRRSYGPQSLDWVNQRTPASSLGFV